MINKRLFELSCNKDEFDKAKLLYEKSLQESGYKTSMSYAQTEVETNKNRSRNIIWFNPSFSQNVKTNIDKMFLKLIKKHFPNYHRLHKIFNLNTIKLSYCCMGNMSSFTKQHNRNILSSPSNIEKRSCNCRNKDKLSACWQLLEKVHYLQSSCYQGKWNTRILWCIWWRVQVSVQQSQEFVSESRLWEQNWTLKIYLAVKT